MARRLVTQRPSRLGINYYHESMGFYSRTNEEINADLDRILTFTNKIKVYNYVLDHDNSICLNVATLAKAKGFHVTWVENPDGNPDIDFTIWDGAYTTAVLADAAAAEAIGVDIFIVGNETSLKVDGVDFADYASLISRVKTLVTSVKAVFTGQVSFQEGWWKKDDWFSAGLGSLDKIYFNVYEAYADFVDICEDMYAKFGNNLVIGEFSAQNYVSDLYPNGIGEREEDDFFRQIANRINTLKTIGIEDVYYFTYKEDDGHGVVINDIPEYRKAWNALASDRIMII